MLVSLMGLLPAASAVPPPAGAPPAPMGGAAPSPSASPVPAASMLWNTTTLGPGPAASGSPVSAVPVTPPPVPPPTVPTVVTLFTANRTTSLFGNFTSPVGAWGMIVLNYTGSAFNGVYDSSFRFYLDQSLVLMGTTPEYGTWTVTKDITEYTSLFHGLFNVTFLGPSAVLSGGYFESTLSIAFYPAAPGQPAPIEPNLIEPLWYRLVLTPSNPVLYVDLSLPTNVTNATLELYAYGFGLDEFWYTLAPGLRNIEVMANGTAIASVYPFQYINTGGIDLFTWRPITGVFTLDDRPYRMNLTAAAGLLEGSVNLTAHLPGISAGSDWVASGSLLLYTEAAATPSTFEPTAYAFNAPAPSIQSTSTGYAETATVSYHYSSFVGFPGGSENVTLWRNLTYSSDSVGPATWLGASWSNLTATETASEHTVTAGPDGPTGDSSSTRFSVGMDSGEAFVETSSTNGTYPIFGNFTDYFDAASQEWWESDSLTGPAGASGPLNRTVDYRVDGPANQYAGSEERTSPTAALLLSISFIESQTIADYEESAYGGPRAGHFSHVVYGSAFQPPGPNNVETIVTDVVNAPLVVAGHATNGTLDVGLTTDLAATATGGLPPYTFAWSGLPTGCAGGTGPTVECTPTGAGTFAVTVATKDATGATAPPSIVILVVHSAPVVALTANRSLADVGVPISVVATTSGGTAPLTCQFAVGSASWSPTTSCSAGINVSGTAPGTLSVNARVTDALGVVVGAVADLSFPITAAPIVGLPGPTGGSVADVPFTLTPTLAGGAGAFTYTWYLNGTPIPGSTGATLTYVPLGAGNYSFAVAVHDAGGGAATSPSAAVAVAPPPKSGGPGASSSGSGSGADLATEILYLVLGVLVGVGVGVVLMRLLPPPRRGAPPRARSPATPRPRTRS